MTFELASDRTFRSRQRFAWIINSPSIHHLTERFHVAAAGKSHCTISTHLPVFSFARLPAGRSPVSRLQIPCTAASQTEAWSQGADRHWLGPCLHLRSHRHLITCGDSKEVPSLQTERLLSAGHLSLSRGRGCPLTYGRDSRRNARQYPFAMARDKRSKR